jgi:2-polyprenyl-3-methyl-5-hydroxy-6-metoxy-1,4-benzoquinol methylase
MKTSPTSVLLETQSEITVSASPRSLNGEVRVVASPSCFLCGKAGQQLYRGLVDWLFSAPGTWGMRSCADCEVAWLDPQPAIEDIPNLYSSYYTHVAAPSQVTFGKLRQEISRAVLSRLGYSVDHSDKLLSRLLSRVGPIARANALDVLGLHAADIGSLLDVGCGNGYFMERMRSLGWSVTGVDPDPSAVSYTASRGLAVFQGGVADVPDEARFDVIVLSHVIEHVPDPIQLLRDCERRLRPGIGRLIITTPNAGSLGHRWFKPHWRGLEIPRHLILFSATALGRCVAQAGLLLEDLRTETRLAVRIHNASACARAGERMVAERTRFKASTKIAGYFFMVAENMLMSFNPQVGEELFCICRAPQLR